MKEWKSELLKFLKFNIVGILNTLVDFVVYQLLMLLGMWYVPAQCISYGCGMLNSYFCNSRWTFRGTKRTVKQKLLFVAVNLVTLGISTLTLKFCYETLGISSNLIAKAIAAVASVIVNFAGTRLLVFK